MGERFGRTAFRRAAFGLTAFRRTAAAYQRERALRDPNRKLARNTQFTAIAVGRARDDLFAARRHG